MGKISPELAAAVYRVVQMVPAGQVATYGQIATYVISPRHARAVGSALRDLPQNLVGKVPWHRIINASGMISARGDIERPSIQERLLQDEGIQFSKSGKVNLAIFGWTGPGPDWVPLMPSTASRPRR